MWSEALSVLDRAERLQRQFFTHVAQAWEPPIDVVEEDGALRVHVALPGAAPGSVAIGVDDEGVVISAARAFPCADPHARIHRIEIPYGRFERRIAVDARGLELREKAYADGVLSLTFRRKEGV